MSVLTSYVSIPLTCKLLVVKFFLMGNRNKNICKKKGIKKDCFLDDKKKIAMSFYYVFRYDRNLTNITNSQLK